MKHPDHIIPLAIVVVFLSVSIHLFSQEDHGCPHAYGKKAEKLYDQAMSAYKQGKNAEATRLLNEVIDAESAFVDAYFVLGLMQVKKREPNIKEAEKHFLKVIELCPDYDAYTYYYLGDIFFGAERWDESAKYLDRFLLDVEKIKNDEDYERAVNLLNYANFFSESYRNPKPFRPVVVEGISTIENEYLPIISPDGQIALYTREIKLLPARNELVQRSGFKERFMYSNQSFDGTFEAGEEMPEPFNVFDNEGGATLTADNNRLYYTVCQRTKGAYLNCDIFYSDNAYEDWSSIQSIGKAINQPDSWESQPSISADGKTLYFVSDRSGGYGGYDIYQSVMDDNGVWGAPENLGKLINTNGNEKAPFIHSDSKTLYFSSDGRVGMGGYDIFYSRLQDDRTWKKPVNIGYPINSADDDVGFFVSTDGKYGYFCSNKLEGKGGWDLYSFELYDEARPEKILFLKGTLKDEGTQEPVRARIELKNIETRKISEIPLDTLTGKYLAIAPFTSDYVMTFKKEGYVFESRYLSQEDTILEKPAQVDVEIKPIEIGKSYVIRDIYFSFNSFELTSESTPMLDELVRFMEENPTIRIEIQGHTDNIGKDADNQVLSERRAGAVYHYLIEKGISAGRLSFKGYGESMPVAGNDTEEGRSKNRRTVFVVVEK